MKTTLTTGLSITALALSANAQSVGNAVRIDTGDNSAQNETTVSVSKANPNEIVAGWNDYRNSPLIQSGFGLSLDGGQSWSDFILRPPVANQTSLEGDPMTAYDDRTGAIWAGAIAFGGNGGVYVARKDAGNAAFNTSVMAEVTGGADKCWMAAGPGLAPNTTSVYIAYNEGVLRSSDLGDTWLGPVPLGNGIGWLPRVGPNGELYVMGWDFGNEFFLRRSFDGGQTLSPPITVVVRMGSWCAFGGINVFPGQFRVPSLPSFGVDPNNGNLYCVYPDITNVVMGQDNVDIYFTRSVDQGSTWSTPIVVNGDANPPGDQFFPFVDVDASGKIHVIYYDSRHNIQNDNSLPGLFDTYYAVSDDQGASFTEFRLTQSSWNSQLDGFNSGFAGDYLGISTAGGRSFPVYMSTQDGEANIYTNVVTDDGPTIFCTAKTSSAGCVASISGSGGQPTSGANDYSVNASSVQGQKFGVLFGGNNGAANIPFNGGILCVNPPTRRSAIVDSGGSGPNACDGSYSVIVNDGIVFPGGLDAGSGNSGWYQYWYRDPNNGAGQLGTALSNAAQLDFQ